jgi:hypothetical protein
VTAQKSVLTLGLKKMLRAMALCLFVNTTQAEVRIFVQDSNSLAFVNYQCTSGEIVRAFALDVSVDRGAIVGISNFFRGESKPGATGYGIFPASFRDHLAINGGTNFDWGASEYTPLAAVSDSPGDTLPGLNSNGATLEFGALWNPNTPGAIPASAGTLCALKLSQAAHVSVAPNATRGSVVSAVAGIRLTTIWTGAAVGPQIISTTLDSDVLNILFQGGQLQAASRIDGPWVDTGEISGRHSETIGTNPIRFFRVRAGP